MNREILFRGKRNEGKWYYGFYWASLDPSSVDTKWRGHFIHNGVNIARPDKIYPDTLGQYTGLADKNGVKIFEGDIVNHQNGRVGVVWFDSSVGAWAFGRKPIQQESWYFFDCGGDHDPNDFEVIGNIHDNPELI